MGGCRHTPSALSDRTAIRPVSAAGVVGQFRALPPLPAACNKTPRTTLQLGIDNLRQAECELLLLRLLTNKARESPTHGAKDRRARGARRRMGFTERGRFDPRPRACGAGR